MNWKEIGELLSDPRQIVITAHQNPDADAIGSSLALMHWLRAICSHTITVIVPNDYPEFLHFIPGNSEVKVYHHSKMACETLFQQAEIIFVLDYNAPDRIGEMAGGVLKSKAVKIMIDHHLFPADFVHYTFSKPSASSTAEMVYTFMQHLGWEDKLTADAGTCIYAGIVSDTGGFKHALTPEAFEISAKLVKLNIPLQEVGNALFNSFSEARLRLFGHCLAKKMELLPEKAAAIIYVDEEDKSLYDFQPGDTEGLVNYPLMISWVKVAVLITEKDGLVKLSFRSKGDYNVQAICQQHFQGGGHYNASGGRSRTTMRNTIEQVKAVLQVIVPDTIPEEGI